MQPLTCWRNKLHNLSRLNCGLQIRQVWIQLTTACGNTARKGVQNTLHWSGPIYYATDTNGCHNDVIQLGPLISQSLFQFFQISTSYSLRPRHCPEIQYHCDFVHNCPVLKLQGWTMMDKIVVILNHFTMAWTKWVTLSDALDFRGFVKFCLLHAQLRTH